MRVALVRPGTTIAAGYREPLSLEYLAGYLEERGVDVRIVDGAVKNAQKELAKISPDLVGITAMTPDIPTARDIANWCRKNRIRTVAGGIHATIDPSGVGEWADHVVVGDGESALWDIISGKKDAPIICGAIEDISLLPLPARHLVDYEYYLTRYIVGERTAAVLTSRGCPWRCIYCWNSINGGSKPRYNPVERVIAELEDIVPKYKIKRVFFQDDNLFIPKQRFIDIMRGIKHLGIKVEALTGASSVVPDVISVGKECGLDMVDIGFESGSQQVLDNLNKQIDVGTYQRAMDVCRDYDIKVNATFMVGNPGETWEDIELTRKFISNNKFYQIGLNYIIPYPGTKLWENAQGDGMIPEEIDWGTFQPTAHSVPMRVNQAMTAEEITQAYNLLDAEKPRVKITLGWIVKTVATNPLLAIKQLWKDRKRLGRFLRRIKW